MPQEEGGGLLPGSPFPLSLSVRAELINLGLAMSAQGIAVRQRQPFAGLGARLLAVSIDGLLGIFLFLLLIEAVPIWGAGAGRFSIAVAFLLYHPAMESSPLQGTLGKLALGIKVTDLMGRRIRFDHAIGRHIARLLYLALVVGSLILFNAVGPKSPSPLDLDMSAIPPTVAWVMCGFTARRQALHDMLTGTLVIRRACSAQQISAAGSAPPVGLGYKVLVIMAALSIWPLTFEIVRGINSTIPDPAALKAQVRSTWHDTLRYRQAIDQAVAQGTPLAQISTQTLPGDLATRLPYVDAIEVRSGVITVVFGGNADGLLAGARLSMIYGTGIEEHALSFGQSVWTRHEWGCRFEPLPGRRPFPTARDGIHFSTTVPYEYLPHDCGGDLEPGHDY